MLEAINIMLTMAMSCRSFEGHARKIAQLLAQMGKDLAGKRELVKLSPWLASYSAPVGAHQAA
jgi:hypothetical protein